MALSIEPHLVGGRDLLSGNVVSRLPSGLDRDLRAWNAAYVSNMLDDA
jgi:hypothetical protein